MMRISAVDSALFILGNACKSKTLQNSVKRSDVINDGKNREGVWFQKFNILYLYHYSVCKTFEKKMPFLISYFENSV